MFPVIIGAGIITSGYLLHDDYTRKRTMHLMNIIRNVINNHLFDETYQWWNVIDSHLILGALPLKNKNHLEQLVDINVGVVLSIVEKHEMLPIFGITPLTFDDYDFENIDNIIVEVPDHNPVPLETIINTIKILHKCVNNNKIVYIHCKVGKGRSVMIVVCYLLKHGLNGGRMMFESSEKVIEYVKNLRPVINLNKRQMDVIHEYEKYLKKNE
jgi:hypothetical protein